MELIDLSAHGIAQPLLGTKSSFLCTSGAGVEVLLRSSPCASGTAVEMSSRGGLLADLGVGRTSRTSSRDHPLRHVLGKGINSSCEVLHAPAAVLGSTQERERILDQPSSSKELVVGCDVIAYELLLNKIACGLR